MTAADLARSQADMWAQRVAEAEAALIPASRLYLSPRMSHYYGHGDTGDARE